MKIDHIAIWTDDIETMRDFYLTYFDVTCGNKYVNPIKISLPISYLSEMEMPVSN